MDEEKELTDLSKLDWANLTPQKDARMQAEEKDSRTEEDMAAAEAQSKFLVERSPSPTEQNGRGLFMKNEQESSPAIRLGPYLCAVLW